MTQTLLTAELPDLSKSTGPLELGVRLVSDVDGQIIAVRFWKLAADVQAHVGRLWDAAGHPLASVAFVHETAAGWQEQALQDPITVTAGTAYLVSVNVGAGAFAVNANAMPLAHDALHAAVCCYGPPGAAPVSQSPHNYFRDVLFVPALADGLVTILAPTAAAIADGVVPVSGSWDSAGAAPGPHTITVSVDDQAAASVTVIVPAPAAARLLQAADLVSEGAFKLPHNDGSEETSFAYGGAIGFDPRDGALYVRGHEWFQKLAKIGIPAYGRITSRDDWSRLATAPILEPLTDALEGRLGEVGTDIGGVLPYQGRLVISVYVYYDGGGHARLSHFVANPDLRVRGDLQGPYEVDAHVMISGTPAPPAGFVSGWLTPIPATWQAALGGPVLIGQGCLSVISRTSYGPAAFAIDPAQFGLVDPLPAVPLLYYPADHPLASNRLGVTWFNLTTRIAGAVFPEGTGSVLFFGSQGLGSYCYGEADFCQDPARGGKGGHGPPYLYYCWAYDVRELAAVAWGERRPWEVEPYAVWPLDLPFPVADATLVGATSDPETGRIFLSQDHGDGAYPLINVFSVKTP